MLMFLLLHGEEAQCPQQGLATTAVQKKTCS